MVRTFDLGFDDVQEKKRKAKSTPKPNYSRKNFKWKRTNDGNSVDENLLEEDEEGGEAGEARAVEKNEPLRLVVGIDFGTTYSGVAWGSNDDSFEDVAVIQAWRGTDDKRDKVPTIVAFKDRNNRDLKQWGYEVTPQTPSSSWFKLKMGQNEITTSQDDPLLRQAVGKGLLSIPEGMTAEEIAQKYLQSLHEHVMKKQMNLWGAVLEDTPITYVLTVPADWKDAYKEKLQKAAIEAGIAERPIDRVMIVSEPEAAARAAFEKPKRGLTKVILKVRIKALADEYIETLGNMHVIRSIPADVSRDIKKDRNVVVIDMGGGTVDLVTYRIIKTEPFRVGEACAGTSAKCGGTSIDRALHELMGQKYGPAFWEKGPEEISHGSTFMKEFESIKRSFEGEESEYQLSLMMDVQDIQGYNAELGKVTLTAEEISAMFAQVIDPSIELLSEQVQRSKGENKIDDLVVILCGGLSESPFVVDKMKAHCKGIGAQMILPADPWSAIARGAVLYGLWPRSLVASRKCRWSYGLCVHRKYEPEKDSKAENDGLVINCPIYGKRVTGCMKWHIKREDVISQNRPARINGYIAIDKRQPTVGEIRLYQCRKQKPPDIVTDEDVEAFCSLQIDLSRVRDNSRCIYRHRKNSLKSAVHIKVYQQVCLESEEVEFKAIVGRTTVGCVKVPYEPIDDQPDDQPD